MPRNSPGRIGLSKVAKYLGVSPKTAKRFLKEKKVPTLGRLEKRPSYAWVDIWYITGIADWKKIPPARWPTLKEPLLVAEEVAELFGLEKHGAKRIRERAACGLLPVIKIGHLLRFRRSDLLSQTSFARQQDDETSLWSHP